MEQRQQRRQQKILITELGKLSDQYLVNLRHVLNRGNVILKNSYYLFLVFLWLTDKCLLDSWYYFFCLWETFAIDSLSEWWTFHYKALLIIPVSELQAFNVSKNIYMHQTLWYMLAKLSLLKAYLGTPHWTKMCYM